MRIEIKIVMLWDIHHIVFQENYDVRIYNGLCVEGDLIRPLSVYDRLTKSSTVSETSKRIFKRVYKK